MQRRYVSKEVEEREKKEIRTPWRLDFDVVNMEAPLLAFSK